MTPSFGRYTALDFKLTFVNIHRPSIRATLTRQSSSSKVSQLLLQQALLQRDFLSSALLQTLVQPPRNLLPVSQIPLLPNESKSQPSNVSGDGSDLFGREELSFDLRGELFKEGDEKGRGSFLRADGFSGGNDEVKRVLEVLVRGLEASSDRIVEEGEEDFVVGGEGGFGGCGGFFDVLDRGGRVRDHAFEPDGNLRWVVFEEDRGGEESSDESRRGGSGCGMRS